MQKKVLIIIGIIVLAGMIAGGAFLLMQKSKTPMVDDWKTYSNAEYGFEMKYPNDWEAREYDKGTISFIKPDQRDSSFVGYSMSLDIEPNVKNLSAKDFVENLLKNQRKDEPGINYKNAYELTVAGLPAYELDGVFGGDGKLEWIYISHASNIFTFRFYVAEKNPNFTLVDPIEYNRISHQIISTFKFTSPQNQTTGWKMYSNAKYGFEIKIPANWITIESEMRVDFISPELATLKKQNIIYCEDNNDLTLCITEMIPADVRFTSMYSPHDIISQKETAFNSIKFTEYVEPSIGGETHYSTTKNGRIFDFVFYSNNNLASNIFSNFKITN